MSLNLVIIQARMGSTRLPGKVLKNICGKPLIWHVINRVNNVPSVDLVVVATTIDEQDDVLVNYIKDGHLCEVFRGSERNVLKRFYKCATKYNADVIIRVTADDPFKDPSIIEYAIKEIIENGYDYCSNTLIPSYPEGLDIEVFKRHRY